jgi:transposase InsO family protein
MAPTNHRVRRPTDRRRTVQERHHPMPKTIRRTRNIWRVDARPPNTKPALRCLKSGRSQNPGATQILIGGHTKKKLLTYRGVNAGAESFFATLKRELIYRYHWNDPKILEKDLFRWIEVWHNNQRTHTSLGLRSPNQAPKDHYTLAA